MKNLTENDIHIYEVALSFASEDREYVSKVAQLLKNKGIRVFYDEFNEVESWGKELTVYFKEIFEKKSKFCIIFSSKNYVEKPWTNHERQCALSRALISKKEYILPARFDDTEIPGIPSTIKWIDLTKYTPEEFTKIILEKLNKTSNESLRPLLAAKPGRGGWPGILPISLILAILIAGAAVFLKSGDHGVIITKSGTLDPVKSPKPKAQEQAEPPPPPIETKSLSVFNLTFIK